MSLFEFDRDIGAKALWEYDNPGLSMHTHYEDLPADTRRACWLRAHVVLQAYDNAERAEKAA